MREELRKLCGLRTRFRAVVDCFGERTSHGHAKPMVLLRNVTDVQHGQELTDHVWFDRGKWVEQLNLQPGDEIEFDARVGSYRKGYIEKQIDYKLNHPTRIIKRSATPSGLPLFDVLHL